MSTDPMTRRQERLIEGYGRYDPPHQDHIGCPRAKTDMTPCVARDGIAACGDNHRCIGCQRHPAELLTELVRTVTSLVLLANETDLL